MRKYKNGSIQFGRGSFDDWAVIVDYPGAPKFPKDVWYFSKLLRYKFDLGPRVYDDFVQLYEKVGNKAEEAVFDWIQEATATYLDPQEAELVFGILYMAMIAEENKAGAILKKRIKRLGVHQILVEGVNPKIAADYSRGRPATELVMECHSRGF